nr:classical arabinogalactan protein 9-like [Tanacetum cinerariifolium]
NKFGHFSDNKLGINIPARGECSDLLHAEEEKNDYEWLLTPPDTPLFRSLDDEAPQVDVQRGRPRTQPISISRSLTMEKSRRSSRGSASPNRVSVSPQSHNSAFEGGGKASSAPSASQSTHTKPSPPNLIATSLRKSSPSRKPSSPVPRSSTPTNPRRLSTGSTGSTSSKGSRGS